MTFARHILVVLTALSLIGGCGGEKSSPFGGVEYEVLSALRQKDFERLADFVHGERGVQFSPYAWIDTASGLTMDREELATAWQSEDVLVWGVYDGSGEPMEFTFRDYFERFVWDHDYTKAEKATYNTVTSYGNAINNIEEAYPGAEFVEFYFSGFEPQYEGMDWRALTLVFEKVGGDYKLVGIVHAEWTI